MLCPFTLNIEKQTRDQNSSPGSTPDTKCVSSSLIARCFFHTMHTPALVDRCIRSLVGLGPITVVSLRSGPSRLTPPEGGCTSLPSLPSAGSGCPGTRSRSLRGRVRLANGPSAAAPHTPTQPDSDSRNWVTAGSLSLVSQKQAMSQLPSPSNPSTASPHCDTLRCRSLK